MTKKRVMVVTGANTGLGLALVRNLLKTYAQEAIVYLTARNEERGLVAVKTLNEEGLEPAFHLLDVAQDESVQAFARHIEEHHGGIDVLISNAAARILPNVSKSEQIETFINTNNHGTYRIIHYLSPLLKNGASFLVVASSFGSLRHLNPQLHNKFDPATKSLEDINHVMDEYMKLVLQDKDVAVGWADWMNIPSKIGQVALMKIFARHIQKNNPQRQLQINAVCPGLVDTEASRPWFSDMSSAQSPDEAAVDVIWLTTSPPDLPYGELIQHRRVIPFNEE